MARTTRPRKDRARPAAAAGAGTELYLELARTVAALAEPRSLRSFTLPYPGFAQRALDHTVMRCLGIGRTPPRSLPELWEWCRSMTADDPLFDVPSSLVTRGATLVTPVGLMPTRTCLELASHGPAGQVETEARGLLAELEGRCGSTERYRLCRRFLADHPVVQQEDRHTRNWSRDVWAKVKELYQPLPESLRVDGVFLPCPVCRLPALPRGRTLPTPTRPAADQEIWCEGEECLRPERFEPIRDPDLALILPRSLRAYLVLPHPVETAARNALDSAGIRHEARPGHLSAHHVRDTGHGPLEMHVYDRLQPGLLAAHLAQSPPHTHRAFIVVPERLAARDGYRASFTAALPEPLRPRLILTTPSDLVRHLTTRATESDHTMHTGTAHRRSTPASARTEAEDDA
ncbi:hypothetical protein AB0D49_01225 [Streptomyces sp. NPDC048290]|uniref:pPIWI_RE_Y domain-containing protein n=1 Tax=Streptomyces sp. NPDC048290 TaxID=3155811 RepID=UPI003426CBC9